MKAPPALLALIAFAVAGYAVVTAPMRNSVSLEWDYDTNNPPDVFKLYTSPDMAAPVASWSLVGTVSGNVHNITVSGIPVQQGFYYVTASNWWGESNPSNFAWTPQTPGVVNNLRISLP